VPDPASELAGYFPSGLYETGKGLTAGASDPCENSLERHEETKSAGVLRLHRPVRKRTGRFRSAWQGRTDSM